MACFSLKKIPRGSITAPLGFLASGMHSGIKKKKHDVALIYSKTPSVAAAVFTINQAKAWPVLYSMKAIKSANHHAIFVSSGNANCLNGSIGKKAVDECVQMIAKGLGLKKEEVLIAQTGVIGVPFPIETLKHVSGRLIKKLSKKGSHDAAKGILTTDRSTKEIAFSFNLGGKKASIGAISKGAGMVHPHMATMLCFITTDVAILKPLLQRALKYATEATFNKISIDNDMSTNDMAVVITSGMAGNALIQKADNNYKIFRRVLEEVMRHMAYEMVRDGEGVSHVCTLKISGAKNFKEAESLARSIANSMLFKTMLAGADPNWGRIAAAVGASGIKFNIDELSITFGNVVVLSRGKVKTANLTKARQTLEKKEYDIFVSVGGGRGKADFVTSDLTTKYVQINAAYS